MIRRAFKIRTCTNCGKEGGASAFNETKSRFFTDGRLPICKDCLNKWIEDNDGEWALVNEICCWANVPFIPEDWTKLWKTIPSSAMGRYLDMFFMAKWDRVEWEDYEARWKEAIKNNEENLLHPAFNQEELAKLVKRWGAGYSTEEYERLQELYDGIYDTYGFSDKVTEDSARKLSKVSLEMDRAIAKGEPIDKLTTAYSKIKADAGFVADNAKDTNSFESVSELVVFMERTGWDKKFHNGETKDIVDITMKNIQNYSRRLWDNESTMADQVEARIEAKKRMDELEERALRGEDIDSDAELIKIDTTNVEDEDDEFVLDLDMEVD